jgi:phenylalanine-4-hydroxylase
LAARHTPTIATYTDAEQEVWRIVCAELHNLHLRLACAAYLEGKDDSSFPRTGSHSWSM